MVDVQRRTKIVCTLGPAVASLEGITGLVEAGMDVARLNFSHGEHEDHAQNYRWVREASDATGHGVPGASFKSVQIGIRAQIQHLKAYASTGPPRRGLVDPRFGRVPRGSAPYVEDLSGTWAADPHYGAKIRSMLRSLARS